MTLSFPLKYTTESLKYGVDWSEELDGGSITSAALVVEIGDVQPLAFAYDGVSCTFVLTGGSPQVHRLRCDITTDTGEQLSCPITLQVLQA